MKRTLRTWRHALAALLPLAFVLAACDDGISDLDTDVALRAGQAKWEAAGVQDYSYVLTRLCPACPVSEQGPVRVEVRGGVPVSVTYTASDDPAPQATFAAFDTVEELFAFVQSASQGKPARLVAAYDAQLGYPTEVQLNPNLSRTGDEDGFTVGSFQRL